MPTDFGQHKRQAWILASAALNKTAKLISELEADNTGEVKELEDTATEAYIALQHIADKLDERRKQNRAEKIAEKEMLKNARTL